MGLMRTVGGASDAQLPEEAVSTLNHCPYRQIPGAGTGAGSAPAKRVPVLFSTNRGLYLRLAQPLADQMEVMTLQPSGQNYNISFCDLERWSTNRANVVSLEDTFSIMQQRNMSPESMNYQPRLWKNNVSYSLMH
uniref:IP21436p n=1 Tax=Drosophila melanogaster TaxID=7227 RepID=B3DN18_DROME|nr:IP21436p [Drosophila melanogaster]